MLRQCVTDSNDLVQGMYDPLLALVLHTLGEPDAYEVATRSQARTDTDPNVVTAAMVIALELAARSDQLGAREGAAGHDPGGRSQRGDDAHRMVDRRGGRRDARR